MAFFPPIPLISKNVIMKYFKASGATSEDLALSLDDTVVVNPNSFKRITDRLVEMGWIQKTPDGKYYV